MILNNFLKIAQCIISIALIGFIFWQLVSSGSYEEKRWILYTLIILNVIIAIISMMKSKNIRK